MVNEYFGVGVVSGAMDGAAPELNPGRVHRRINTCSEVRHAQADASKNIQNDLRLPYLMGIAFPSTGHPNPIRGYAIRGCAGRDTHKVLIEQCCCLLVRHAHRFGFHVHTPNKTNDERLLKAELDTRRQITAG